MVAGKVREQGQQFEDVLRERENGKPKFTFLWDERVSTNLKNKNGNPKANVIVAIKEP